MDDHALARYFADLARSLLSVGGVQETMDLLVASAVEVVEACDHASISHMKGRALVSASSNDSVGYLLDGIQTGADEGPCLDSIRTGEVMTARDLLADERWPTYGPAAVDGTGVRSSIAHPLHDGRRTFGALNLFSDRVDAFGGGAEDAVSAILVAHCAAALAAALQREDMTTALRNRDLIGQAKGLLMARAEVGEDRAFEMLVGASQRMNVKLVEVAHRLVTGTLVEGDGVSH